MDKYEKAIEILKKYNQEHVINILNKLKGDKKETLINQILFIDFEELEELHLSIYEDQYSNLGNIEPIEALNTDDLAKKEIDKYVNTGIDVIKNNKFAIATMAGRTRDKTSDIMDQRVLIKWILVKSGKYLFEVIVDTLKRANKEYDVVIPWYIMTSKENNDETIDFLENKNYFGYPKEHVVFFKQGEVPFLDEDGKVLIGHDYLIKEASNGNGGIFNSMLKNGVLDDMKKRGVEWIFIGSIDNVLLKLVDVLLIGLTIENKTLIGTRTVLKADPKEKVGILCKQNGRVKVIEYTELPEEIAVETNAKGELKFGESHIMCNLFNIKALEKASTKELKYHIAFKKADYLDHDGNCIDSSVENAYKFEKFIFDAFNLFEDISILRGKRQEDFAPVKNARGTDTPKIAKKLYENYWESKISK